MLKESRLNYAHQCDANAGVNLAVRRVDWGVRWVSGVVQGRRDWRGEGGWDGSGYLEGTSLGAACWSGGETVVGALQVGVLGG